MLEKIKEVKKTYCNGGHMFMCNVVHKLYDEPDASLIIAELWKDLHLNFMSMGAEDHIKENFYTKPYNGGWYQYGRDARINHLNRTIKRLISEQPKQPLLDRIKNLFK